ncbi:hypothetical protein BH24DEI2_BH24DEI2_20690 [soil metagenome]
MLGVPDADRRFTPQLVNTLQPGHPDFNYLELASLRTLQLGGVATAPVLVVPAAAEERFYRLNNLVPQLEALFKNVDPADPDEDDLEEFAPDALALFKTHFLLDEFIDVFYDALHVLPPDVRVRRPGRAGVKSARGRPALVALKDTWAADWSFEALEARLERTRSFTLEARPVLLGPATETPAVPDVTARVAELVQRPAQVWTSDLGVSRLSFED